MQIATRKESRAIPMQSRLAPVGTVDNEARTVEMVFCTAAPVTRRDWWTGEGYIEKLSMDPSHVRMERFKSGLNIINTHQQSDLASILGVAESGIMANGEGRALARFSKRADVEPYFLDIVDGIIRNASVGYIVHAYQKTESAGGMPEWLAVDWEPCEISLVPVPADGNSGVRALKDDPEAAAKVRTFPCDFLSPAVAAAAADISTTRKEIQMPEAIVIPAAATTAAVPAVPAVAAPAVDESAVRAAATAAATITERTRAQNIQRRASVAGMTPEFIEALVTEGVSVEVASTRIVDALAARAELGSVQRPHHIEITRDQADVQRAAMQEAILVRAAPHSNKPTDASRQYRGMTLLDMARDRIEVAGGKTRGLSRREIAVLALNLDRDMSTRAGAMATSDFPQILASTVNRTLRAGYEQYPRTFMGWARSATVPDFRQAARTQLSEMSAFLGVNEGGEYKYLSMGDTAEKYSLAKSGGLVALTWESIINDDLNAFDRLPMMLGAEAAATQSDIVYGILSANAALSDTVALFNTATHKNLAAAGTAITDVSLGVGRALIRKQTGLKGRVLNLTPDFLVVGPDKEVEANKYTSAQFVAAKAGDINPNFNTSLEVVVDPRVLATQWYLMAKPQRIDTVEYAFLEGEDGLYTETQMGFEVDGLRIKARMVFAAKAIDFKGMYSNPGA